VNNRGSKTRGNPPIISYSTPKRVGPFLATCLTEIFLNLACTAFSKPTPAHIEQFIENILF
jgi:hypothetical protein